MLYESCERNRKAGIRRASNIGWLPENRRLWIEKVLNLTEEKGEYYAFNNFYFEKLPPHSRDFSRELGGIHRRNVRKEAFRGY